MSLRIIFMGSSDFAVPVLGQLVEAGRDIISVYSQPPKPAGRGKKLRSTPVHQFADIHGLEVRTPKSLKEKVEQDILIHLKPDIIIIAAYGLILPQAVLDIPEYGCINLHGSLLPRWRGAAPIQRAIMAGDCETGVQLMHMEVGLDTGPIYATARTSITQEDNTASLHDRLADLGAKLLMGSMDDIVNGQLQPQAQSEVGACYAKKILPEERAIDWTQPAEMVDAHIRGLSPIPGATFEIDGGMEPISIKALFSCLESGEGKPGQVLDDGLRIACGRGAIRILRLQRPGKSTCDYREFLRGMPIPSGTRLR